MTDDFQLFQDQGGGDPVDADIALITAYLARELSPVQIVAVEDRLAKDAPFRDKVRPIIAAWVLPTPLPVVHAGAGPLSREEIDAGWQRYLDQHAELDAHEGPRLLVESRHSKRRKVSMTRIAAGVAAVALPFIALAQVTLYVAKHPAAPGHSVAKQVVAPFVEPPPSAAPLKPEKPVPSARDVPVGRQLENTKAPVQRAAEVKVPVAETPAPAPPAPVTVPVWVANPDRTKISALVSQHLPELIRGDTSASYVVMVMDAADNYVWSTYGSGTLQIVIGGDKRSFEERMSFTRDHSVEYTGFAPGARGSGGGGRGGGRARGGGSGDAGAVVARVDTLVTRIADGTTKQSVTTVRVGDSVAYAAGSGGGRSRSIGIASAQAGPRTPSGFADTSSVYTLGFSRFINGQPADLNLAAGLQEPGKGESGIQGLKAASLTTGETYIFAPGQLLPTPLRVAVVHLAPGTSWKGR